MLRGSPLTGPCAEILWVLLAFVECEFLSKILVSWRIAPCPCTSSWSRRPFVASAGEHAARFPKVSNCIYRRDPSSQSDEDLLPLHRNLASSPTSTARNVQVSYWRIPLWVTPPRQGQGKSTTFFTKASMNWICYWFSKVDGTETANRLTVLHSFTAQASPPAQELSPTATFITLYIQVCHSMSIYLSV